MSISFYWMNHQKSEDSIVVMIVFYKRKKTIHVRRHDHVVFNINKTPENSAPSVDSQVSYDLYEIGQLIGEFDSGLAFMDNMNWEVDFNFNLLEEGEGINYNKPLADIGNVGNRSPFVFVS
jgi:hypothetical protein